MVSIARGRHAPTTGRRPPRVGPMRTSVRVICGATAAVVAAVAVVVTMPIATTSAAPAFERREGADRYATAAAVSRATFTSDVPRAFVASGQTFPDALAGGPAAKAGGGPVLLVARDALPQPTADELRRLQPKTIVVLGGAAA